MAHYNTLPTCQQWQKDVTAAEVRDILAKVCVWLARFVEEPNTDDDHNLDIDVDCILQESRTDIIKQLTDKGFQTEIYKNDENGHDMLSVECLWK